MLTQVRHKNFYRIAAPLTSLTRKVAKFKWTDKCEEAFQELKERLTNALVLALLGNEEHFVVYSDASKSGFRCIQI